MRFLSIITIMLVFSSPASAQGTFKYSEIKDLDAMTGYIKSHFPLGTSKESLRKTFVQEGGATQVLHPQNPNIEKYIYDINLCSYYVWRWNISADYDAQGKLVQAYMNGVPVFAEGPQIKDIEKGSKTAKMFKVQTPRPLASKGEKSLASLVFDSDGNAKTIEDQQTIGGGPSRPDPMNMGTMHIYKVGPLWRTIFDHDKTRMTDNYAGDCKAVDAAMEKAKASAGKKG